jgi:hypothetical protein
MKVRRGLLTAALAASLIVGEGTAAVVSAPPASAGCLSTDSQNTYCDEPVAPDGTWHRCHQNSGHRVFWGGWVYTWTPPTNTCYRVDPSRPWPSLPLGQPQFHVDD